MTPHHDEILENPCRTYYELYRDYVKQENTLINNRLLWSLSIQGFLFAAFAYADSPGTPNQPRQPDQSLGLVFCAAGIVINILTTTSLVAADVAIFKILKKWRDHFVLRADMNDPLVPDLTGGGSDQAHALGHLGPAMIPVVAAGCWLYLVAHVFHWHTTCVTIAISLTVLVLGCCYYGIMLRMRRIRWRSLAEVHANGPVFRLTRCSRLKGSAETVRFDLQVTSVQREGLLSVLKDQTRIICSPGKVYPENDGEVTFVPVGALSLEPDVPTDLSVQFSKVNLDHRVLPLVKLVCEFHHATFPVRLNNIVIAKRKRFRP